MEFKKINHKVISSTEPSADKANGFDDDTP